MKLKCAEVLIQIIRYDYVLCVHTEKDCNDNKIESLEEISKK